MAPRRLPETVTAALRALAEQLDRPIDLHSARSLRLHDAATVLLPDAGSESSGGIVVRLVPESDIAVERADRALSLTSWLASHAFPSVRPAHPTPIRVPDFVITLWTYVAPEPRRSTVEAHGALGHIIRELHRLPPYPGQLPNVDPFARLRAAMTLDAVRPEPVLRPAETTFLRRRMDDLAAGYGQTTFPLGRGLIHNDAHPGNLLAASSQPYGFVLADWESACSGPRELDVVLAGAPASRFGKTEPERLAFTASYGYDIAGWPGYVLLRDIRDIHSLAGHLRAAPRSPEALRELRTRLASLLDDDRRVVWKVV